MKTDRELIELAAKAAGVPLKWPFDPATYARVDGVPPRRTDTWENWNPITTDGDALRLAVKLGLHISQQLSYVTVCQPHGPAATRGLGWAVPYGAADAYAATRRAIVHAAAAMAEQGVLGAA
jgi:hypothetical protein